MTTWYEWKVQCSSDSNWYNTITKTDTKPTVCPNNAAHGVTEAYIIGHVSSTNPQLQDENEDGRVLVSPGLFPDYMNPYFTSKCDDFANGTRGDGTRLVINHPDGDPETTITELRFVDYIQILGGWIRVQNAGLDDYISFDCVAPATPVTVNGSGTGNCNLVEVIPTSGLHIIIPAAGDGGHDVDITTAANANVAGGINQPTLITQAVPVSAYEDDGTPNGYWDWDRKTGAITANTEGKGNYNLYDWEIVLSKYVNEVSVYSDGNGGIFKQKLGLVHRGGPFLPHWKCRIHTTRAATHQSSDPPVIYTVVLTLARKSST